MTFKDIQTNYLADDFNTNVTLDNGDEIELCFPTIGNEITMNQMLREPEKYSVTGELDDQMLNIAFHIKKLNGKEISIMKAYEYITSGIDGYSFSTFCNAMADVNFGIKPFGIPEVAALREIAFSHLQRRFFLEFGDLDYSLARLGYVDVPILRVRVIGSDADRDDRAGCPIGVGHDVTPGAGHDKG